MKRILLLIVTNFAVLAVLSISMQLLGIDSKLQSETGLNLQGLLLMAAIFGFGGAFISLFISKWMAKRATGAQVIEVPSNMTERWLVDTVKRQAEKAGIGMPEVAVYESPEINAFATGWNRNSSLVAVSTVMWLLLHRSVYGRHLFATGRNEIAARYSGINTQRVIVRAYVILGVLTGLAAIVFAFYTNSISPSSHGNFFELYGIAAAVLGGCRLRGGEG